jgi:hypothetical protein
MSEDMLGSTVRALLAVPQSRLGLIKDFAHKLSGEASGEDWAKKGALFLRGELVALVPEMVTPVLFKAEDADLNFWLQKSQEFTKKFFGVEVDFRKFEIPKQFPWGSVLPVFDPGNITNRQAIEVLQKLGLKVWEEVDVMEYTGSEVGGKPSLTFIQKLISPDGETMGMSPNQLVETGKNWLYLRGYTLAFGLYCFATSKYLDTETFTWFPNCHLSAGGVAHSLCRPAHGGVGFGWFGASNCHDSGGARLAMPVSLVP